MLLSCQRASAQSFLVPFVSSSGTNQFLKLYVVTYLQL